MADTPTPPPPPPPPPADKPKARVRRTPPRHADAAKPTRSHTGGTTPKRTTTTGAKRAPTKLQAPAAPTTPPSPPAPARPEPSTKQKRFRWQAITAAGVGAIGALAGLLALRGSTPHKGKQAHQADGTDSSASFDAGIADEGTIPEKE